MSVEALITMVKDQPNRDLIASLSIDSAFLQLQQSNFQKARLEMSNASVVAFFETQETPTVQKNVSMSCGLIYEPILTVMIGVGKMGDVGSIKTSRFENISNFDERHFHCRKSQPL